MTRIVAVFLRIRCKLHLLASIGSVAVNQAERRAARWYRLRGYRVLATNVFERAQGRWWIVSHHGSPVMEPPDSEEPPLQ